MGCFCHKTLDALTPLLPRLHVQPSQSRGLAQQTVALAELLGRPVGQKPAPAGPPAPPPRPLAVPTLRLGLAAIGTISALADLRASAQQQFGIDLLAAGQSTALARIVATLNARSSALASKPHDASAWVRLAALNGAIDHVRSAPAATPGTTAAKSTTLHPDTAKLAGPAVLAAAVARLNVDSSADAPSQLAAALRTLRAIALPPLADPKLVARLTAGLSALAQLRDSLGVDPLNTGFAAVAQIVSARLDAAAKQASTAAVRRPTQSAAQTALKASLQASEKASANMSQQIAALASINWQVPRVTALAAITVGLPVCTLAAQLKAALGIAAVRSTPCGPTCDAARLARALAAS